MSGSLPSIFESRAPPSLHHHGRICRHIGGRAACLPPGQPGALDVCRLPLSGINHGKRHQNPGRQSDARAAGGGYWLGCSPYELLGVFMGSLGMAVISQNWGDTVQVLGAMDIAVGITCSGLWLLLSNRPFIKQFLKPGSSRLILFLDPESYVK